MARTDINPNGVNYVVAVEGLDDISDLSPDKIKRLASMAVNATARRYRTEASRALRAQVAFPASYLDSSETGNLRVSKFSTPGSLEAVVQGRFRPTSLARFVKGPRMGGVKSPTVEVAPGHREQMKRAFLLNLRNGNVGLAVRLKPGERIENKSRMVKMSGGLYLLYGPSVDQVFREVAEDVSGPAGDYLETEFARLVEAKL